MSRSTCGVILDILVVFLSVQLGLAEATGPPEVVSDVIQSQLARVGETVRLTCPVREEPRLLIQWSKNGESINRSWERFKIQKKSNTLVIKGAVLEDTGKYQCKATNGFGHVNLDYVLTILDVNQSEPLPAEIPHLSANANSPRFNNPGLMLEDPVQRPINDAVTLPCGATGNPAPIIFWYRNGIYFDNTVITERMRIGSEAWVRNAEWYNSDDSQDDVYGNNIWTLSLPNLAEGDSGEYQCVVSNLYGEIKHTYNLQVSDGTAKPELIPPNPQNTTVEYGDMASFMCEVRSISQPHIQWLKKVDGLRPVNISSTITVDGQQFLVLQAGEVLSRQDGTFLNKLTIERATERDSGMYICLGANNKGYIFRSAFLTVLPDPYKMGVNTDPSFWDNQALPIIIGVPAGLLIIIIIVISVCVMRRKHTRNTAETQQNIVRVPRYPPQGAPYVPPLQEKAFDHQYAALHPQSYPQTYSVQDTTSQDRMVKTYSDKQSNSDSSFQCPVTGPQLSGTPPVPVLAPTPTLVQQHTHMHYYQRT